MRATANTGIVTQLSVSGADLGVTVGTRPSDRNVFFSVTHQEGTTIDADITVGMALSMATLLIKAAQCVILERGMSDSIDGVSGKPEEKH